MFLLLEIKEALIKMKIKKHIKLNKTIKSWKSILNYLKCACVCVCACVCYTTVYFILYVTQEHKTSHNGQFFEIEIYASSES